MRVELRAHPDTPSGAVTALEADVVRTWKHGIALTFRLRGNLAAIRFPARAEPKHVDGLWQTTCFEAFVRDPAAEEYCEYNLSPSTEFAIYGFDRYRDGMKGGYCSRAQISTTSDGDLFELRGGVDFMRARQIRAEGPVLVGLSAVIEEMSGVKSYWALAHPPGKPDFHHADGFVLELP